MSERIKLGVSACLLGQNVRYDGQHKLDHFIRDTLGAFVDFVPVCPEVECGLPVPREAMRLVGDPSAPRLLTQRTGHDLTCLMLDWAQCKVLDLEKESLCGFIFKSKSPSSGMANVKVYNGRGGQAGRATGMFARVFMEHFPLLPVEEEGRLNDVDLRENFIERIFALKRYREAITPRPALARLTGFHAAHKLLIMAHSPRDVPAMGRLLAKTDKAHLTGTVRAYESAFLKALASPATPARHTNVLHHMLGYLRKDLDTSDREELQGIIEGYRNRLIPLVVPVTLFRHYVRKYDVAYLKDQIYLDPHPLELKLRNHA